MTTVKSFSQKCFYDFHYISLVYVRLISGNIFRRFEIMFINKRKVPSVGPVAQSVGRWTPCGGSTRPGFKSPGFEARRAPDVYRASCGYGCGWWQAVASQSSDRDRPCAAMCVR